MVFWLNTSFAEHVKGFYNYAFVLALNRNFKEMVDVVEIVPEKPTIGKAFKKEGKIVMDYLAQMDKASVKEFEDKLNENGWEYLNKKLPFSRPENLTLLGTEREFRLGNAGDISLSFSFVVCSSLQVFFFFISPRTFSRGAIVRNPCEQGTRAMHVTRLSSQSEHKICLSCPLAEPAI